MKRELEDIRNTINRMSIWESTNEFGITCQQHLHTKELEKLVRKTKEFSQSTKMLLKNVGQNVGKNQESKE